jgi:hypothetical protein
MSPPSPTGSRHLPRHCYFFCFRVHSRTYSSKLKPELFALETGCEKICQWQLPSPGPANAEGWMHLINSNRGDALVQVHAERPCLVSVTLAAVILSSARIEE